MRKEIISSTPLAKSVAVIVAIGWTLLAARATPAATLFADFDNVWPPDWTAKYNSVNDSSDSGIHSDPDDPNNLVLKLFGVENWSASATRRVAFTDNFIVSARVWNGSEARSPGWGRGSISLEGGTTLFTFDSDGTFRGGNNLILAPYETERWYDITVHYERLGSLLKESYQLDGEDLGQSQFTIPNLPAELAAARLELNAGSTAYFDNVSVMSVPEPAGLLLMIVSAAGMVWRTRPFRRSAS